MQGLHIPRSNLCFEPHTLIGVAACAIEDSGSVTIASIQWRQAPRLMLTLSMSSRSRGLQSPLTLGIFPSFSSSHALQNPDPFRHCSSQYATPHWLVSHLSRFSLCHHLLAPNRSFCLVPPHLPHKLFIILWSTPTSYLHSRLLSETACRSLTNTFLVILGSFLTPSNKSEHHIYWLVQT